MSLGRADLEKQSQTPLWGTDALPPAQPRHKGALAKFNVPSILVGVCLQTWRSSRRRAKSAGRRCPSRRARQARTERGEGREGAAVAEAPPGRRPLVGLSFHNAPVREATDKEWKLPHIVGRGKCGWNRRVHNTGNHAALVSSFTFSAE